MNSTQLFNLLRERLPSHDLEWRYDRENEKDDRY